MVSRQLQSYLRTYQAHPGYKYYSDIGTRSDFKPPNRLRSKRRCSSVWPRLGLLHSFAWEESAKSFIVCDLLLPGPVLIRVCPKPKEEQGRKGGVGGGGGGGATLSDRMAWQQDGTRTIRASVGSQPRRDCVAWVAGTGDARTCRALIKREWMPRARKPKRALPLHSETHLRSLFLFAKSRESPIPAPICPNPRSSKPKLAQASTPRMTPKCSKSKKPHPKSSHILTSKALGLGILQLPR